MGDDQKNSDKKDLTGIWEMEKTENPPETQDAPSISESAITLSEDDKAMFGDQSLTFAPVEPSSEENPISIEVSPSELSPSSETSSLESLEDSGISLATETLDAPAEETLKIDELKIEADSAVEISTPSDAISEIKQLSQELAESELAEPNLSEKFDLRIEGPLKEEEKSRLIDLITRENMGFREMDLEPQFASNQVFLPKISEYAAVLLIQALRGTSAKIKFSQTVDSDEFYEPSPLSESPHEDPKNRVHPAELIPTTQGDVLSEFSHFETLEVGFTSQVFEIEPYTKIESSKKIEILLEGLERQLKFKAYRRGAQGILHLNYKIEALTFPGQHRVTLSGTFIKKTNSLELS